MVKRERAKIHQGLELYMLVRIDTTKEVCIDATRDGSRPREGGHVQTGQGAIKPCTVGVTL